MIPLEVHSHYSLLRGTLSPKHLCDFMIKKGYTQFAIADTNNLYGMIFLYQTALERGLDMIIGATLDDAQKRKAVLLVKDNTGYSNLCRLISQRHAGESFDLLKHLTGRLEGLVMLTQDRDLLEAYQSEDVYVSLQSGSYSLYHWAREKDFPSVANIPAYMGSPKGHQLHRIMRAINLNTKLSRLPEEELIPIDNYLHSRAETLDVLPFAEEALERTMEIAAKCQWRPPLDSFIFPDSNDNRDYQELKNRVYLGAQERYGNMTDRIRDRIEHELKTVKEKRFSNYFLTVQDIVKQSPITCGRGSAAASIVAYTLKITHVDPIRHNLFFERFLSPGRKDPPDIDVDFPWDTRDEILQYTFDTYGDSHSAMICNHVTFKARAAIREVAKVFGLTESEIGIVTKRLSHLWYVSDPFEELANNPLLSDLDLKDPWPEIIRNGFYLAGFPRHLSVHPGGVVLTPQEIRNYVPIQRAPKGVQIIQWEKDQAEDFGLIKIDLLGNRSLAVIRDILADVHEHYGVDIPYWKLNPLEDLRTQELIRTARTMGCFYVESPATRQLLSKMQTGDYENLVIASSIIRPAANKWIREFVRRLHGGDYDPLHPLLDETLKETYGIMVYQEDVTRVAMRLAGFDADEGNELRKVMSKKHKEAKLRDYCEKFVSGARKNGVEDSIIETLWEMIMSFSGYSFCKPHSASYALVSFKSAYLKAHYPAEFIASVMTNLGGYYSTFGYYSEARRLGLKVLLPSINNSEIRHTGLNDWVQIGFMQLKGIKRTALEYIVAERESNGRFLSFESFLRRMPELDQSDVRILIKAGSFDGVEGIEARPSLMWQLYQSRANQQRRDKPVSLLDLNERDSYYIPDTGAYSEKTMLIHEADVLGFLISRHPLSLYAKLLQHLTYVRACDLRRHVGKEIPVIGWLITGKVVHTKNDEPMEFISFEDTTAIYETVFFPKVYRKFCRMLSNARPYLLRGLVEEDFGAISLTVRHIEFLDKVKVSPQIGRPQAKMLPKGNQRTLPPPNS
ncbi:MAG: DNA polymerase III subunit alpha [FCB group bacterium]|nr:DNA polymerase III subunit alpha [FCB group bacterium]MBL7028958.1 DNA polymerase III subunit alpha [Candidatus Neomarinimicrobiota bacterium]MBL7121978.1 DNA polymerase III subunit alpha [Candidatus Neomarinimicrobiota bacterium]